MVTVQRASAIFAIILVHFVCALAAKTLNSSILRTEFYNEFVKHMDHQPSNIDQVMAMFSEPKLQLLDVPRTTNPEICLKCRVAVHAVIKYFDEHASSSEVHLDAVLLRLCTKMTALTDAECKGLSNIYAPTIAYILEHQPSRDPNYEEGVCAVLYQSSGCGSSGFVIDFNFTTNVGETILTESKRYDHEYDSANLTVLHLTDFHYDPYYAEGSPSVCQERICCRNTSTPLPNHNATHSTGKWGDYNACDSPGLLVQNICQQIANAHPKIDYVYYTGDFADHFDHLTSQQSIKESVKFVTDAITTALPNKVFVPLLGNHDTHPANNFAPPSVTDPGVSTQWLYDFIADEWKDFMPNDARESLRTNGYYTMTVPTSGLRIINLNTNVANIWNFWIFLETESMHQQLFWLVDVLDQAEKNGELVHIMAHIPPSSGYALHAWAKEYDRIAARYAHIISGQFFGHTHYDEWTVNFKDTPNSVALSVPWTAGSGTAFIGLNSNYRLYFVDSHTFNVLDHDTWIFNLTEANTAPVDHSPNWFKEYSFRELYNVSSCSPAVLGPLVARDFFYDENLTNKYWTMKYKQSEGFLKDGCNDQCRYELICEILRCN